MKKNYLTAFEQNRGWILFILLCLLWLPWLGSTPFYTKGEPREAIVAVSMLNSGNWILPVNGGWEFPFKPPMLAWLIAIFAKVFNGGEVNEDISRLPSALAAITMIMCGYLWASRLKGPELASRMALVTATSFEVFRSATACRVDMLLTAAMVCALYCLYMVYGTRCAPKERRGLWLALALVLLSIAVLTKGPVGCLLPCAIIAIYRLFNRDNFLKTAWQTCLIAICSLIVPAIWYYMACRQGGDVFFDVAWEENIGRLTGTMSYQSHVKPIWYNFVSLLGGMLPWTLLVVPGLIFIKRFKGDKIGDTGKFALICACVVILFYCIPQSKRSVYLMPAYPFLAYFVAICIEKLRYTLASIVFGWLIGFLGVLGPLSLMVESSAALVPGDLRVEGILPWAILISTIIISVTWLFFGARRAIGRNLVIYMLYLSYGAALMPALFREPLKTAHATELFQKIKDSTMEVRTIGKGRMADEVYWFNFYLDDRIRRVESIEEARSTLSPGDVVILPISYNPQPLMQSGEWTIYLLPFNPDTRGPVNFAIRRE